MSEKEFIANVAHELRTPITVIRGFAETLCDFSPLSPAISQEISSKILSTSIRLEKLINSLLTLSEIEHLSYDTLSSIDLLPIVQQCKALAIAAHPDAIISIDCDGSQALVQADADLLEMAIMNLLDNGIKYSSSFAQIAIQIRTEPEFTLQIEDQGIGIKELDIPHIFDRFYRADKTKSNKKKGVGLGLSIVKTILEKHRGQIAVFSREGKGTRFTITLPTS